MALGLCNGSSHEALPLPLPPNMLPKIIYLHVSILVGARASPSVDSNAMHYVTVIIHGHQTSEFLSRLCPG